MAAFANAAKDVANACIRDYMKPESAGKFRDDIHDTMTADLSSPGPQMNKKISFGQVTLSQRLVVDLTADIPTVTDFQISQDLDW